MELTRDAILSWVNAVFPNSPAPTFESLGDGHHFYRLLQTAAPYCFTEDESSVPRTDNRIMKKANLSALVRDMNQFGLTYLKATEGFDLVGGGGSSSSSSSSRIAVEAIAMNEDVDALQELAEYVATMAALAGSSALIDKLKTLSKDRQVSLNSTLRRIMTLHGLKKAVAPTKAAGGAPPASGGAGVTSSSSISNHHASIVGGGGSNSMNTAAVSGRMLSTMASQSNNNNNDNDGGALRSNDDPSVLRGELNVLRNELRDKTAALDTAESKCNVAEQQLEQLQARYRLLLEQSESRGTTSKERELQQALAAVSKRDDQIAQLSAMLSDLEVKNRELITVRRKSEEEHERIKTLLETERKRTKELVTEKSDVVNQLTLVQDMLLLAKNKNENFEKELLKRETEESVRRATAAAAAVAAAQNNLLAGGGADAGGSSSPVPVDGAIAAAGADDLRVMVVELKAKLAASEGKIALLERMGGGGGGLNNESAHTDDDSVSNSSMSNRAEANLGGADNNTSFQGGNTTQSTATAATAAAVAAITAECEGLKAQLEEANAVIMSLEGRLHDAAQSSKSQLETLQMKLKQAADEASTRGAEALQAEIEELRTEKEAMRMTVASLNTQLQQQEDSLTASAAAKVAEVQQRLAEGRKAMLAEQAVVTSVVFHCGQRSLALQQRNLLGGAAVPHIFKEEAFSNLFRRQDAYEKEMVGGSGSGDSGSETFMSKARIAGLWGSMRSAGGSTRQ